jgi:hypothetical protein
MRKEIARRNDDKHLSGFEKRHETILIQFKSSFNEQISNDSSERRRIPVNLPKMHADTFPFHWTVHHRKSNPMSRLGN